MSGFSDEGLAAFERTVAAQVSEGGLPGLVALVASGDDVHVATAGSLSVGGSPVQRDSQWRIASTTKPVTGAATMILAGEGLIDLDEPVDRLVPELADRQVLRQPDGPLSDTVPAARPVTVRDLLTFTFGFGQMIEMFMADGPWPVVAAANELELGTFGPPDPDAQPGPDEWLDRLGSLPLVAQPGKRWLYNTGAAVLGALCGRAAGTSFAEVLRTRVFAPLGMSDTGFFAADPDRLATAYLPGPDGLTTFDPPDGRWSRPPAFGDGSGGLVSTVDDLLAFARVLLAGGAPLLSADAVAAMTADHLTDEQRAAGSAYLDGRGWGFCQAVVIEGPRRGAYGWDGGFGSSWLVDPSRDLVVIVEHQRLWTGPLDRRPHDLIEEAAYRALSDG